MDRVIFHCDLNAFYASVELLSYPELREKPVAVCGDPAARHGIILAKNEAAKAQAEASELKREVFRLQQRLESRNNGQNRQNNNGGNGR